MDEKPGIGTVIALVAAPIAVACCLAPVAAAGVLAWLWSMVSGAGIAAATALAIIVAIGVTVLLRWPSATRARRDPSL